VNSDIFHVEFACLGAYSIQNRAAYMSDKELRELIDTLQDVTDEYASSPEKAREFLQQAGILTNAGELSDPYKS
jgi:hypothetical protein